MAVFQRWRSVQPDNIPHSRTRLCLFHGLARPAMYTFARVALRSPIPPRLENACTDFAERWLAALERRGHS